MKRLMLGMISLIVLFFIVLAVLDKVKRPSEPDEGQEAQSSGQAAGPDGASEQETVAPTPTSDRTIKLSLSLPETDANTVIQLLPSADQLIAGDAYALYQEASNALPPALNETELSDWGRMKPDAMPLARVKSLLDQTEEAFLLVDQAILCKDCNWPAATVGAQLTSLGRYRTLARLIGLKAAYESANNNPQGSIQALRMGFGMARQVAQGPTINHGMAGIGIAALTSRQIPVLAEQPNGVSLYAALENLPSPLISLEEATQVELDNLDKDPKVNFLNRRAFLNILKPAHERCRVLAKRFDRDLKALQCLEAIRLYAAVHHGDLPETLSEITHWKVPQDPVNEQPFVYALSGDTAILESPASPDEPKSRLQYEISVRPEP
ncbi:MAG: hypothetical protein HQ515_12445 [Phycisphaeraceae bacterium]|nr:hypothetical protein [Phycisphaeraceae bacterium]